MIAKVKIVFKHFKLQNFNANSKIVCEYQTKKLSIELLNLKN